jgi:CheY-like chemotaxis protein
MLNGARVLVVEDEPLIAMDLAQTIEDQGGIVTAVRSRQEALEHSASTVFDAAILDVRLPDGTVFDVAEQLKSGGVPFMFCTADNEDTNIFSAWPGVVVISKPHNGHTIISSLQELLSIDTRRPGTNHSP